ncbi:MAG: hypothetical protein EB170_07155 [Nitrosopumilaceae archaeon]|nr:hypothetical protein [Nitrosopumilaceae archaeon]
MASLTVQETRAFVEKLMASGKGDPGRLAHILTILREGRQLYNSDKRYLDEKFSQEIGLQEQLKVDEDVITKTQKLITSGAGDTGRLQFILESLKKGKTLYKSDEQYLESKLGQKINYDTILSAKHDSDKTIDVLKSQVSWANQKIASLESVIQEKMVQLQSAHKPQGTLPKGHTTQSLDQIQRELAQEEANLSREKTEAERIKIEQSKLTQIILDRKEFEKQVAMEKENIKTQIEQERQNMETQNRLVEQIKAQEAQLETARRERDGIISQLQKEQADIAIQAESERAKLAEQALVAKQKQAEISLQIIEQKKKLASASPSISQLKSDQELLNKILSERAALESQVKTASADLKLIKKEKTIVEKQLKSQKLGIAREKKKEESKIKKLEQKKKLVSKSIASESEKIKKLAKN